MHNENNLLELKISVAGQQFYERLKKALPQVDSMFEPFVNFEKLQGLAHEYSIDGRLDEVDLVCLQLAEFDVGIAQKLKSQFNLLNDPESYARGSHIYEVHGPHQNYEDVIITSFFNEIVNKIDEIPLANNPAWDVMLAEKTHFKPFMHS